MEFNTSWKNLKEVQKKFTINKNKIEEKDYDNLMYLISIEACEHCFDTVKSSFFEDVTKIKQTFRKVEQTTNKERVR